MPAIASHSTETVDRAWDGPGNVARLRTDEDPTYYRRMFAWVDPDGDPATKAAYKFPHHEVDGEGNIGPANVRACIAGIAVLNGARGGADIPDADRRGVYNHLARHLRDAEMEPPELQRSVLLAIERRAFPFGRVEVRAAGDAPPRLVGYAAVFDLPSEDLGGFTEVIRRGAFSKTLREADIRALWNHDENYVFGRTKSGTLHLAEDDHGLRIEIAPPDTTWARDVLVSIQRGDVDQMSFSFRPVRDRWQTDDQGRVQRELLEVALYDVSPVTFPAYPQTEVQVRSAIAELQAQIDRLAQVVPAAAPPLAGHPAEEWARAQLALYRKRLELLAKAI